MFQYYNANPYGRIVNDCSVRALSLALQLTWDETYIMLSDFARAEGITFSEIEFIDQFLGERFEHYCMKKQVNKLKDFTALQLDGRWLITMAGHITCVVDGVCYDTFDPSERYIWCVYKVK